MRLLFVVLVGLAIGSFLNVVIARLPERRSLFRPRSACPGCRAPIAWYDNIPITSFLVLRRRCRACRARISWTYPLVEAATSGAFVLAWTRFGPTWDFVIAAGLVSALIAITVIDLRHQIIPDAITLPGILVGLLVNLGTGRLPWHEPVIGILIGGGIYYAVIWCYARLLGVDAMGGGDVKLGAMLGAFLGWKLYVLAFVVSSLVGGLAGIVLIASGRGRKHAIPFGPFLAIGGAVALLWGEGIVSWYVSMFVIE